jgi:hypothetical protein
MHRALSFECRSADMRVPYDEAVGAGSGLDGSCEGGSSGGCHTAVGSRCGQLCVQCFSTQSSPSGAHAKLCAVLLLQPDTERGDSGGGSSSGCGGELRPVAWIYFRSAPPLRAAWWWLHPLGVGLVGGCWPGARLPTGDDAFQGAPHDPLVACPVTDAEPVVEVWLAGTGPPPAARDAVRPTSRPIARRGDRPQPAGPGAIRTDANSRKADSPKRVAGGPAAAAVSAGAVASAGAAAAAAAAAVARGLWQLVAAGRDRWRCVSSLAIVTRQQLSSVTCALEAARSVPDAEPAAAASQVGAEPAAAPAGHRAATPLGQLRALAAAGATVLDLAGVSSPLLGTTGGGGGRDEETAEAASARLRVQVAALPRTHPRLQVLLLPALLPRAPR